MMDILLDEDYNFKISTTGDFEIGDSEAQHIRLLFDTFRGDWTQNPLVGIGLVRWKNGILDARFERETQLQFEADGLGNLSIDVQGATVFVSKNN